MQTTANNTIRKTFRISPQAQAALEIFRQNHRYDGSTENAAIEYILNHFNQIEKALNQCKAERDDLEKHKNLILSNLRGYFQIEDTLKRFADAKP